MDKHTQAGCMIAALLLQTSIARADGSDVVSVPAGEDKISPLRKGEVAPFEGQLFDNNTSLRWANWLVQYKTLLKANAELEKRLCLADTGLLQKKLDLEEKEYTTVTTELQSKLSKAQSEVADPPFYRSFGFGMGAGVAVTLVVVIGAAVVLNASGK